jgi:RNA polymerase sigma-70 factor (ECF subfamily)
LVAETPTLEPSLSEVDVLMARYAAGDDRCFAALYDLLAPRLYGFLFRRTRDRARAEDLVQQTLLQMHCARGRFLPGARVLPWMYAIANRLAIDSFRREGREIPTEPRDEGPGRGESADEVLDAKELAQEIGRELERIPESQRVAFELVKLEGLSLKEAAESLGTTVTSVKLRTHRAYQAIRNVLGDVLKGSE